MFRAEVVCELYKIYLHPSVFEKVYIKDINSNVDELPVPPILHQIPILASLSDENRSSLMSHVKYKRYKPNSYILRIDDEPSNWYIITKGTVKISNQSNILSVSEDTYLGSPSFGSFDTYHTLSSPPTPKMYHSVSTSSTPRSGFAPPRSPAATPRSQSPTPRSQVGPSHFSLPPTPKSVPNLSSPTATKNVYMTVDSYFGEESLLKNKPQPVSVITVDDVEVLEIDAIGFDEHLGEVRATLESRLNRFLRRKANTDGRPTTNNYSELPPSSPDSKSTRRQQRRLSLSTSSAAMLHIEKKEEVEAETDYPTDLACNILSDFKSWWS